MLLSTLLISALFLCSAKASYGSTPLDKQKMICLVNNERTKAGSPPLKYHPDLLRAAQEHSQDQANQQLMTHQPDFSQRYKDTGYQLQNGGENVAEGQTDEASVMDAWMHSDGHRRNILCPDFVHFGAGRADSNIAYWTQAFGAGDPSADEGVPDCSSYGTTSGGGSSSGGSNGGGSSGYNSGNQAGQAPHDDNWYKQQAEKIDPAWVKTWMTEHGYGQQQPSYGNDSSSDDNNEDGDDTSSYGDSDDQ